jgi:DNA adenine methylase
MLIRFAGSKDRAAQRILEYLDLSKRRLCEPFAGTAAVTFAAIEAGLVDHVCINDLDRYLIDLWSTVLHNHERLIELVADYTPRAQDFYDFKAEGYTSSAVRNAFTTIVLHQISFGGLGRMSGSPIGGADQRGKKYTVECRWNAARLTSKIAKLHNLLASVDVRLTSTDWSACPTWAWFVDPPYVEAGKGLYRSSALDHLKLMRHLRDKQQPWVLTYDDAEEIRDIYKWAAIEKGHDTYLNHGGKRTNYRKTELMIMPHGQYGSDRPDRLPLK